MLDSPAVRTLSRYLVARFVQLFFVAVFVAVLSISVIELLLNLDRMTEFGDGPTGALEYLWLRLASEYASYILPLAAFLAAFSTAALAAYAREWMALKAGGVTLLRFALPLLGCGLFSAAAAGVFHEVAVVEARQQWSRQRDGDANIRFREGAFWYQRGNRIYRVAEADRDSHTLHEVRIFERDDRGRLQRSITAETIEILDDRRWLFRRAVFRDFDPESPTSPARIEQAEQRIVEIADPRDRALLHVDPDSLSIASLREFIAAKQARDGEADAPRALLYSRFGDWASIALLVGLAIPIGLSVDQSRSLGRSATWATLALAGFYSLRNIGSVLSVQGLMPPAVPTLSLLAVLFAAASIGLLRVPR